MADRFVNVFINARDLTGNVFQRLQSEVTAFENAVNRTSASMGGLGNAGTQAVGTRQGGGITGSLFAAELRMFALYEAINLVQNAFTALGNTINDASTRQLSRLGALITNVKTLGLTYEEAGEYAQEAATKIAGIGRDSPTNAENINKVFLTIQDDYNLALRDSVSSLEQLQATQIKAATQIALLSDIAGGNLEDTRSAIIGYLSGSVGPGGLDIYRFFGDNPLLRTTLIDLLEQRQPRVDAQGNAIDSFGDLPLRERVEFLNKALDAAINPKDVELLQDTARSQLSSFLDKLFDPEIGLFSIQRDLEPEIPGYQSVFETFTNTLELLIGEQGVFAQLARLLGFGDFDPMRALNEALITFNQYITNFRDSLLGLQSLNAYQLGVLVGNFITDTLLSLSRFILTNVPGFIANTFLFLGGVLGGAFTRLVGDIFNDLFIAPFQGIFTAIGDAFVRYIQTPIQGWIDSLMETVNTAFEAVMNFFKKIGELFNTGFEATKKALGLGGTADSSPASVVQQTAVGAVASTVAASSPVGGVLGFLGQVGGFLGSLFSPKYQGAFIPAANGFAEAIATEAKNKPFKSDFVIANSSEYVLTKQQMKNLINGVAFPSSNQVNINFGTNSISLNLPVGTPESIAMQAIAIIEQRLSEELELRLT